jgi:drug/metabolite transporter (DMT)-like permease
MAGVYGFFHDQISYTISPEYFTHLKFNQFNITEALHNRIGAGIVGIMATWWMGIVIGIIVIPVGLIIPGWKNYLIIMLQAFICICLTALSTGIIAMIYGLIKFDVNNVPMYLYSNIPDGVENKINFCVVGNMHNFSYIGGIAGIIVGLIYIIIKRVKIRNKTSLVMS